MQGALGLLAVIALAVYSTLAALVMASVLALTSLGTYALARRAGSETKLLLALTVIFGGLVVGGVVVDAVVTQAGLVALCGRGLLQFVSRILSKRVSRPSASITRWRS